MLQIYFSSILCNFVTGVLLVFSDAIAEKITARKVDVISCVFGFLSVIVGIVKLFLYVQPDIMILGDLLPALAGIIGGCCLLVDFYLKHNTLNITLNHFFEVVFVQGRKIVGFICMFVAIIHFIVPEVRIL